MANTRMCLACTKEGRSMSAAPTCKGLCMACYKSAKDAVAAGRTTWVVLSALGLAEDANASSFTRQFNKLKEAGA